MKRLILGITATTMTAFLPKSQKITNKWKKAVSTAKEAREP